jgi:hypothetical protein
MKKLKSDWIVKDGLLIFTGHGDNLATDKQYADIRNVCGLENH